MKNGVLPSTNKKVICYILDWQIANTHHRRLHLLIHSGTYLQTQLQSVQYWIDLNFNFVF